MSQSRQLAAIMFTDIVGYTALMGNDEKKAFQSLAQFKSIAQPLVGKFHGNWHKDLGDGALMSFPNVLDAVHCAIAVQKEINVKAEFRLRMGIHLGDVTFKDGDIFGDGVNIASRIQSEAAPGGICVSESIAKNIRNQDGLKAEFLGKRHLKNVDEPVALFQLLAEGLLRQSKKQNRKVSLASSLLLMIATALISSLVVWQLLQPAKQNPPQVKRFNVNLPAEIPIEFIASTPFGTGRPALAVSPNGKVIIYVGPFNNTTALFSRYLASPKIEMLPGTEGAYNPFFSPDGNWVGFFANDRLKKTTLDKREPTDLCRASETWGGCWTTNGKIIFADLDGTRLLSVDEAGGEPEILEVLAKKNNKPTTSFSRPSILPGGNHILFNDDFNNIYALSLKSKELTGLSVKGVQPLYLPGGYIAYLINGSMYAVPFDLKKLEVSGKSVLVQEGIRLDNDCAAHYGFDKDGNLIYAPGISTSLCKLVWVNQNGKEDTLAFPPDYYGITSISPDGKKIAYTQTGVMGELVLLDIGTGRKTNLNRTSFNSGVRWFADSQNIGFSSTYRTNQTQELKLFSYSESTGEVKSLISQIDSFSSFLIIDFSKDGKWFAFQVPTMNNGQDLWIKSLADSNQPAKPLIRTNASEWALRFSPNSQFIAYTSNSSGGYEVYVQGFPTADKIVQVSNGGGEEPVWTSSGRQVIYRKEKQWWLVDVITTDGKIEPAAPRLLFEGPYLNISGPSFDIAPDGRLLLLKPVSTQHSTTELIIIENWFEELKKLAPMK